MPFRLRNARTTCPPAKAIRLVTVEWQFAFMPSNDILIVLRSVKSHKFHIWIVLDSFSKASVPMILIKCSFEDNIDYLWDDIQPFRLATSTNTSNAKRRLQYPTNVTKCKSFLSLCNVFPPLIPTFAHMASPLNGKWKTPAFLLWMTQQDWVRSAGNAAAPQVATTNPGINQIEETFHA